MGKSIRSKIKKRLRTVKRQRVDAMIVRPQTQEHYDDLMRVVEGRSVKLSIPKNAFKYPEAEGAVFAQHEIMKPIDYRSSNLPMAGYTYRGNRRKYAGEQADYMKNMAQNVHPQMEVMAGGGCILAKTGEKISKKQAAIEATKADRPEVAAMAEAGPASASSAVAAALREEAAPQAAPQEVEMDTLNKQESDHARRPIVKETGKAVNRPRSNAVKKKTGKVTTPAAPKKKGKA